ncbi:MAG: thymidylate kinase [Patescibacteria group bacterium]
MKEYKGKLIVIEGTDGSGKATQVKLLAQHLRRRHIPVHVVDFPQYGKDSAVLIERYLHGAFGPIERIDPYLTSILYAMDRYSARERVLRWLKKDIVIANRYTTANMLHQAAKIKSREGQKKYISWIKNFEYNVLGLPKPDKVFFLDVPPLLSSRLVLKKGRREYLRGKKRDLAERNFRHQQAAYAIGRMLCRKGEWTRILCTRNRSLLSPNEIHKSILKAIRRMVNKM